MFGIDGDLAGWNGAPGTVGKIGEIGAADLRGGDRNAVGGEQDAGGGTVKGQGMWFAGRCGFEAA